MKYCQSCGKYFIRGKWKSLSKENEPLNEEDKQKTGATINGVLITICDSCKKNNPTYYQGILQLRAGKKELAFVKKKVKERGNVFINKTKKVRGGWDLYFSDQKFLQSVARMLKKVLVGKLKYQENYFLKID